MTDFKDLQNKVKYYCTASKKFRISYWPTGTYVNSAAKADLKVFTIPADTMNDARNIFYLVVPHDQIHEIVEIAANGQIL